MIKIYYDEDKNVTYTSDTGPLLLENEYDGINNDEFSNFSGNAEYYTVHTKGGRQICEKRYEGEFENGKFNGQGTLYYQGEKTYEGQFKNNKYNGEGTYYGNQLSFTGQFVNGVMISGTSYLNEAHENKYVTH